MKKVLFLPLLLLVLLFLPLQKAEAKIWTKDLVDTVTLDSGYKFSLCSITMNYDLNAAKNAGFFIVPEKDFEGNPANYPCNKQTGQDILFANITMHFNQANGGGMAHAKVLEVGNTLYSVDNYGDIFTPNFVDSKHMYADIAQYDWFSTLTGINGIRGGFLIETDPAAKGAFLPNSTFLVIHDPASGQYASALFVLNNVVYKVSNIISQVTTSTTLVDYTQSSSQPTATVFPTLSK